MSQKIKAIVIIGTILLITAGVGIYIFKKNETIDLIPQAVNQSQVQDAQQSIAKDDQSTQVQPQEEKETAIEGKARSINEKQIFIELADGKGSAININPTTPVRTQTDDSVGNLSILKIGAMVSIKVDQSNNAVEILIKK